MWYRWEPYRLDQLQHMYCTNTSQPPWEFCKAEEGRYTDHHHHCVSGKHRLLTYFCFYITVYPCYNGWTKIQHFLFRYIYSKKSGNSEGQGGGGRLGTLDFTSNVDGKSNFEVKTSVADNNATKHGQWNMPKAIRSQACEFGWKFHRQSSNVIYGVASQMG